MKPTSLTDGAPCDYTSSLDEAFSFVNAFNFQHETSTQQTQTEHETSMMQIQDQAAPRPRKPLPASRQQSQTRVSSHGAKSNCVRQQRRVRKTAELARLRNQAIQLQANHSEFESDEEHCLDDEPTEEKCSGMHSTHSDAANWLQQAALQYEELQKSEQNNNLRAKLSSQMELQKRLETELREATELQIDCRLLTTRRDRRSSIKIEPRITQGSPWIRTEQLHKSMCSLYRDTDAILRQIGSCSDLTSIFSSSQSKRDPVRGPVFELKTSAPVSCCIKSLGDVLWRTLGGCEQERGKVQVEEEKDEEDEDDVKMEEPATLKEDSCEKWCTQNLPTQFGEVQVHGASVVRKFDDHADDLQARKGPLRTVFTFASSIAASESRDLVFRETGWFVLTQLEATSASSLFQTFYRLQIQNPGSATSTSTNSDDSYFQELVMNSLSNRTRKHHQHIQDKLLAHSEESDAGSASQDFIAFDSGVFHGAPC